MNRYQHMADEELVTRSQTNDKKALEVLVHRYMGMVENFCKPRFVETFCDDLQGELWVSFLELTQYYPMVERSFREMVINRLYYKRLNMYRKEKEKKHLEFSYDPRDDVRSVDENEMVLQMEYEDLVSSLQLEGTRLCIVRAIEQGAKTQSEIARRIGIRPQSVREQIMKLRKKLQPWRISLKLDTTSNL